MLGGAWGAQSPSPPLTVAWAEGHCHPLQSQIKHSHMQSGADTDTGTWPVSTVGLSYHLPTQRHHRPLGSCHMPHSSHARLSSAKRLRSASCLFSCFPQEQGRGHLPRHRVARVLGPRVRGSTSGDPGPQRLRASASSQQYRATLCPCPCAQACSLQTSSDRPPDAATTLPSAQICGGGGVRVRDKGFRAAVGAGGWG